MPSLRTLPDRPVSVNPHFAPFSPMRPAQNAFAVAGVLRRESATRVLIPNRGNQVGSGRSPVAVRGRRCMPEGGLVLAQSSNARHRFRRTVLAALVAVLAATLFTIAPAGATATGSSGTGSAAVPELDWAAAPPKGKASRPSSAPPPWCRSTTTGPRASRSPSPLPGSRPATPAAGSARCSSTRAGRAAPESTSCSAPARSSTPTRSGPASTWSGSTPAASSRSTPLRCYETFDEASPTLAPSSSR